MRAASNAGEAPLILRVSAIAGVMDSGRRRQEDNAAIIVYDARTPEAADA